MEISPYLLAKLLLYSVLFGVIVGVVYDAERVVRVFFGVRYSGVSLEGLYSLKLPFIKKTLLSEKRRAMSRAVVNTVIFFGDLFCVILATFGIVVLNYAYNYGEFRMFTVIGTAVGFLIYRFTVGRLTPFIFEPVAFVIKYLFFSFFVILVYPMTKTLNFFVKNIKKSSFLCRFTIEKKGNKVYNKYEDKSVGFSKKNDSERAEDKIIM